MDQQIDHLSSSLGILDLKEKLREWKRDNPSRKVTAMAMAPQFYNPPGTGPTYYVIFCHEQSHPKGLRKAS